MNLIVSTLFTMIQLVNWNVFIFVGMQWIGLLILRLSGKSKKNSATLGEEATKLCCRWVIALSFNTKYIIYSYDYKREYQLGLETTILVKNYTVSWILWLFFVSWYSFVKQEHAWFAWVLFIFSLPYWIYFVIVCVFHVLFWSMLFPLFDWLYV